MRFARELKGLLYKEFLLEWKEKYALNGLFLYVVTMVFVIGLAFVRQMDADTWNIIFWVVMLFVAVNAVAKSFMGESRGQMLYLYTLTGPHALIAAKWLYNCLLLIILGFLTLVFYQLFAPQKLAYPGLFALLIVLGGMGFASNLTIVSAIAAKAKNRTTLLAILSFPLTIPLLLTGIRAGKQAVDGEGWAAATEELVFLGAFIVIIALVSFILFPYLWRD